MIPNGVFLAFGAFFLKHYLVDFPAQPRWMYANKHILGHPGGLAHAALHGIATALVLYGLMLAGIIGSRINFALGLIGVLGLIDFAVHYVIDLCKMRIGLYMKWGPTTSEWFWYLLGFDQLLHYTTYLYILYVWFG